jgi:hypothetical protein
MGNTSTQEQNIKEKNNTTIQEDGELSERLLTENLISTEYHHDKFTYSNKFTANSVLTKIELATFGCHVIFGNIVHCIIRSDHPNELYQDLQQHINKIRQIDYVKENVFSAFKNVTTNGINSVYYGNEPNFNFSSCRILSIKHPQTHKFEAYIYKVNSDKNTTRLTTNSGDVILYRTHADFVDLYNNHCIKGQVKRFTVIKVHHCSKDKFSNKYTNFVENIENQKECKLTGHYTDNNGQQTTDILTVKALLKLDNDDAVYEKMEVLLEATVPNHRIYIDKKQSDLIKVNHSYRFTVKTLYGKRDELMIVSIEEVVPKITDFP